MRVLISGASGFLGSALGERLTAAGRRVKVLSRTARPGQDALTWDPAAGRLDGAALAGVDAVVHLAGASVAGRWTRARRQAIRASRVEGTQLLSRAIAELATPPRVLVCASGINVYGDGGDGVLTEGSPLGTGFLAGVCREWEGAADAAREAGIRVVHLRLGLVLGPHGGALPRMLAPFRLGLGGVMGSGRQYMSWITRDDVLAIVERVLEDETLVGPVNAVSPQPVTNREFTRTLARVLGRPAVIPVPALLLRVLLGQAADELLLASLRVHPAVLQRCGHRCADGELEGALGRMLR